MKYAIICTKLDGTKYIVKFQSYKSKKKGANMALFTFRIGSCMYELKEITEVESIYNCNALSKLSKDAKKFTLFMRTGEENVCFVASIVGDICRNTGIAEWDYGHYIFVSVKENIISATDKIAVVCALQFLNEEKYKQ